MSQGHEMQKHRADMLKGHLETANRRIETLESDFAEIEKLANSRLATACALQAEVEKLEARLSGPGRYLVDGGRGRRVFKTLAEAREWANDQIEAYRARAGRTGKWPGEVARVAIWVGLEQARALLLEDGHDFELMPMTGQSGEVKPC